MDRSGAGQAQGRSRSSGGEERPQEQAPGARAGGCLGGRAGLIGVGGSSSLPLTPSDLAEPVAFSDPGTPSVSEAPPPSDLWSPEALAELAALAEEVLPARLRDDAWKQGAPVLAEPCPGCGRRYAHDPACRFTDVPPATKRLRTLCPVKPEGSLFGLPLIPCPNQPEHNPMTFAAGLLDGACLYPFSPCASADPAGGEPALKE